MKGVARVKATLSFVPGAGRFVRPLGWFHHRPPARAAPGPAKDLLGPATALRAPHRPPGAAFLERPMAALARLRPTRSPRSALADPAGDGHARAFANRREKHGQNHSDRPRVQGLRRCAGARPGARTPGAEQAGHRVANRAVDRRVRRQLHHRGGRDLRRHGPVGLGQIDAGAHAQPADRADGRAHRGGWRGHRAVQRRAAARLSAQAHQHGVSVLRAAAAPDGAGQHRLRAGAGRRAPRRARSRCARTRWRRSGWACGRAATPTSCPAACSSAWAWRARWRPTRRSC